MLNKTFHTGRLTADPEVRDTGKSKVCSFSIAVDRDYSRDGERDTDFFDITAWGHTAEFVGKYFHKGSMMTVVGRLQNDQWEDKDGNVRRVNRIVAENVYFGESRPKGNGSENDNVKNNSKSAKASTKSRKDDDYDDLDDDDDMPF